MEKIQPRNVDSDSDEFEPLRQKRSKIETSDDVIQKSPEDDRERDAIEIQKRHEEFLEKQTRRAERYRQRVLKLTTVSSDASVVDADSSPHSSRPSEMEGRGPRTVPQSVKNYRKRLKKKRSKTKPCEPNT